MDIWSNLHVELNMTREHEAMLVHKQTETFIMRLAFYFGVSLVISLLVVVMVRVWLQRHANNGHRYRTRTLSNGTVTLDLKRHLLARPKSRQTTASSAVGSPRWQSQTGRRATMTTIELLVNESVIKLPHCEKRRHSCSVCVGVSERM